VQVLVVVKRVFFFARFSTTSDWLEVVVKVANNNTFTTFVIAFQPGT